MPLPQLVTDEDIRTTETEIANRVGTTGTASQDSDAKAIDFRLVLEDRISPVAREFREPARPISGTWIIAPIVLCMALAIELTSGTFVSALWTVSPAAVWLVLASAGLLAGRADLSRILVLMQFALCLHPVLEGGSGLVPAALGFFIVCSGAALYQGVLACRSLLEAES